MSTPKNIKPSDKVLTFLFLWPLTFSGYELQGIHDAPGRKTNLAVVLCIVCHLLLRKASHAFQLLCISVRVFKSHFVTIWNVVDVLAILFTLVGSFKIFGPNPAGHSNFMAVVLGLLWLRLIGIFKAVNMHMATFVLSVMQVSSFFVFCSSAQFS